MTQTKDSLHRSMTSQFGRFKIERLLGEGGFASVYLALDPKLNRHVALKIPKPAMLESADAKTRFEREARAAAMLSHPSIVPVFESGEEDGQNYIASAYCPGQTLGSWINRQSGQIEFGTAAKIISELAEAVGHAHQRGIVHRDLKPANVLVDGNQADSPRVPVDPGNETQTIELSTKRGAAIPEPDADTIYPGDSRTHPAAKLTTTGDAPLKTGVTQQTGPVEILGRLRITDFGLAKSASENQELTVEGAIMGTPSYMSPEQAEGRPDVGDASDIYTLGTMLYELIAGKLPFRRDSTLHTMMAIAEDPLPPMSIFRNSVPRDLEAICQKCLEKEPAMRYASAYDLAADLEAWTAGKPVRARIASPVEKFFKLCRRNRGLTSAIAAALLSLTVGLAATTWSWRNSEANLQKANFEFNRAEKNLIVATEAAEKERKARKSAEQVAVFMTGVFRSPDPKIKGRDVKVIDILEDAQQQLSDSFDDDPDLHVALMMAIGDCYRQLGEYKDSIEILLEAESFHAANLPDDQFRELEIRDRLAHAWVETRELDKAMEAYQENLLLSAELEGTNSKSYGATQRNIATALMYDRKFEEAVPYLEENLNNEDLEISAPDILVTKNKLASCLGQLGRIDESTALFEDVLLEQKETLGENHPSCLETANNLAVHYSRNGQRGKAADQQEFLLEQSRAIHGDEHPITIRCMNNLAMSWFHMKNFEASTPLYREVLQLCTEKMGENHVITLSVGVGAARSIIGSGETEEGIALLESIRQPLIDSIGYSDNRTLRALDSLYSQYELKGDLPKAISALQELQLAFESKPESPNGHTYRAKIVRLMLANGQDNEAETVATELLTSVSGLEAASDFSKVLGNLSLALAKVHNVELDEADQYLEFVLSRRVLIPDFKSSELVEVEQLLEALIAELEDLDSNATLFEPSQWQSVLDSI